jgi:hypothetical protein
LRERSHLEDPDVDEKVMLKWIFKKWNGSMDWIDLAHDRDRWRAIVNAVMNLRFPQNVGKLLTSCEPVSFSRRTLLRAVSKVILVSDQEKRHEVVWAIGGQLQYILEFHTKWRWAASFTPQPL